MDEPFFSLLLLTKELVTDVSKFDVLPDFAKVNPPFKRQGDKNLPVYFMFILVTLRLPFHLLLSIFLQVYYCAEVDFRQQ